MVVEIPWNPSPFSTVSIAIAWRLFASRAGGGHRCLMDIVELW
jgi:hypothetical protein